MDFIVFYPKGKNMYIEIIPDKYIHWQPKTDVELNKKADEISPMIEQLKTYCETHKIKQIIIIDWDKAIHFEKLNYVLTCKLVYELGTRFPNCQHILSRIEMQHCNGAIVSIYNTAKRLLPKWTTDILHLYSNGVTR